MMQYHKGQIDMMQYLAREQGYVLYVLERYDNGGAKIVGIRTEDGSDREEKWI